MSSGNNSFAISRVLNLFNGAKETEDQVLTEGLVQNREGFADDKNLKNVDTEILLKTSQNWDSLYQSYYNKGVEKKQNLCINYYNGVQGQYVIGVQDRFSSDNIIFESVETYIPQATRKNPEPVVSSKKFEIMQQDPTTGETSVVDTIDMSKAISIALSDIADKCSLVSEGKQAIRDWLQKQLGIFEIYFDVDQNRPVITQIDALRVELDPNGYFDNKGLFHGLYIKILNTTTAAELKEKYPKHKDYINEISKNMDGSTITYARFVTETNVFIRLEKKILSVVDNPYYTEDESKKFVDSPFNFVGLTFFSDKKQPHDTTGLIFQTIPTQDKLNKINEQIFQNMEQVNASIRFDPSLGATSDKALAVMKALRGGSSYVLAKQGMMERITPPVMGAEIFNLRNDLRNEIKSIFGIFGSTAQGIGQEKTVGGKVITRDLDQSRIGGGITYKLEQVYDSIFNWCVQIMALMMDQEQNFIYEGESTTFSGMNISKPLTISIKENSLIPRDPINDSNLAKELYGMGVIDKQTLLEMVNFPDVQKVMDRQVAMPVPTAVPPVQ